MAVNPSNALVIKELVIGGVRSGKSAYAEQRAKRRGVPVTYIATASVGDAEMESRIALHRERRPVDWVLVEEPVLLADMLLRYAAPDRCLIVDCLTLWLTNLLCAGNDFNASASEFRVNHLMLARERGKLLEVLPNLPGSIILVSSEVGMGIVPMGELSRVFCDEMGLLNQSVAEICDCVTLIVAGLSHHLKRP